MQCRKVCPYCATSKLTQESVNKLNYLYKKELLKEVLVPKNIEKKLSTLLLKRREEFLSNSNNK